MERVVLPPKKASRVRSGLAAVEAALIFPLLFLLIFGVLEYSWMFLKAEEISAAARHGARVAVTESATNVQMLAAIDQLMLENGLDTSGYVVTTIPLDVSIGPPGAPLTVTITVPYANIALIGAPFLPMPSDLTGSTTMAKEGPIPP